MSASGAAGGGSAAPNIVKAQQAYATSQKLAKLFEDLTTALIYARPADPAAFIAAEATRMAAEGEAYRAKPQNGVVDTEESAAAYWEDERVRSLLEVRSALGCSARNARRRPFPFLGLRLQDAGALLEPFAPSGFPPAHTLHLHSFLCPLSLPLALCRCASAPRVAGALCPAPAQQT